MIDFSKIQCTGCSACASSCNKDVFVMGKDDAGFPIPLVVNPEKCVECGICESVCPSFNPKTERKNSEEIAIIAQIKDEDIRKESASGGMFSAIALTVLKKGGIVYGAAYDESFKVRHIGIEKSEDLWRLRNSKYVQSDMGCVFREIKKHLQSGRLVCFSGTPCQAEGLASYLRKTYDNLILVDITCHGVGSPLIWDKYLELVKKINPARIYFRWKHYGYKYSTMSFFNQNKEEIYFGGVETDPMLRAYFTNSCDRKSCYDCKFKKRYRITDFTLWDCFQPRFFNKEFDDDKGTSSVLVNTSKGRKIFQDIVDADTIKYQELAPSDLVHGNRELVQSVKEGSFRDSFLRDAKTTNAVELFEKYFPQTKKVIVKRFLRKILLKTGLYSLIKYEIYKCRRNRCKKG